MLNIRDSLTFDDVLLEPKFSTVPTRASVDLSVWLSKDIKLNYPIIPANMKTILNIESAYEFYKLGSMAIMHRFATIEQQYQWIEIARAWNNGLGHIGFSVGVQESDYKNVDTFVSMGAKIICIDVAHGHSKSCLAMTHYIANKYPNVFLISGNVCTKQGARDLWKSGADACKVGVGNGSICTTRIMTGNGISQLTAISDIHDEKTPVSKEMKKSLFVISDGGVNSSGNALKALCFADLVMAGNLFAGCEETPGEVCTVDGIKYKSYVGSSTYKATHVEGVRALVRVKPPIAEVMQTLSEGIRSGASYQGVNNLIDLRRDPKFVRITNAGFKESGAHDVKVIK